MRTQDIMTPNPACCTPDTALQDVALLMVGNDCGQIPVVDGPNTLRPVGVITDRDITCRTVAQGRNPLEMTARECMTTPVVTATIEENVETCRHKMEKHRIRRLPVVDEQGRCCGMVSQADLAKYLPEKECGETVKRVSEPERNVQATRL